MPSPIQITEVFPNPKGADGDNEFIELKNTSDKPINILGFTLDDDEKGSKPYKLTETSSVTEIPPLQSVIFKKSETSIALNNTSDCARLFDAQNNLVDKVSYDKTIEDKSFSKTKLISSKETKYIFNWTDPSPGTDTPPLYRLDGTILNSPEIKSDFFFTIKEESSQKELKITFDTETITYETALLTFTKNLPIKIVASKTSNSEFRLVDYKIGEQSLTNQSPNLQKSSQTQSSQSTTQESGQPKTPNPSTPQTSSTFIIIFILILLLCGIFALYKIICKQDTDKNKYSANTKEPLQHENFN